MSFVKDLFSGKGPKIDYQPLGFNAGGLNADPFGNITPSAARTNAVAGLSGAADEAANTYGALSDTVGPGFGGLLDTRLNQINDSARSAIGDLRTNLQARRILGSSFGNDTISRTNAEFSRQRDQAIADNFLKSLDVSQKLATQKLAARTQQFQSGLDELNLEANLGASLSKSANSILAQNAQAQAKLDAGAQAGSGALIGKLIGLAAAPFTGGTSLGLTAASSLFGGGGGGNVSAGSYGGVPYPIFG